MRRRKIGGFGSCLFLFVAVKKRFGFGGGAVEKWPAVADGGDKSGVFYSPPPIFWFTCMIKRGDVF